MVFTKTFIRIAAMVAVFGKLAIAPAVANDKMTVLLDWFVNPDHGPLIIAQEKGYFADQGLEVEIIAPADPPHHQSLWPQVRPILQSATNHSFIYKLRRGCLSSCWHPCSNAS